MLWERERENCYISRHTNWAYIISFELKEGKKREEKTNKDDWFLNRSLDELKT